jgi:hypothetical protein
MKNPLSGFLKAFIILPLHTRIYPRRILKIEIGKQIPGKGAAMLLNSFFILTTNFGQIFKEEWFHFLSSSIVGLAAYLLISSLFARIGRKNQRGVLQANAQNTGINYALMVLGLAAAWSIHILLDNLVAWYTTPLTSALVIGN